MTDELPQLITRLCGHQEQANNKTLAEMLRMSKCDKCEEEDKNFKDLMRTDIA